MKSVLLTTILLITGLCFHACAGLSTGNSGKHDVHKAVKIRSGDVIQIEFEYYPDFNQILIVKPDGKVSLQAIGDLTVTDLTPNKLEHLLNEKYGEILAMPRISVRIQETTRFSIYVGGDIKNPGIVKFKDNLNLFQGLLLAGGLKSNFLNHEVFVFRKNGLDSVKRYKLDLTEKTHADTIRSFKLAPFDVVFVMKFSETDMKTNAGTEI